MSNQNWPAWRYGPNGESAVFDHEAYVPDGWAPAPIEGVDYSGAQKPSAAPEAIAALNEKLGEAGAALATKDEQIRKLEADLFVASKREAGLVAELATANARADDAKKAAAAQVEAAAAAHAAEVEGYRDEIAKLRAEFAKFDKDGDGKAGGSAPKAKQ